MESIDTEKVNRNVQCHLSMDLGVDSSTLKIKMIRENVIAPNIVTTSVSWITIKHAITTHERRGRLPLDFDALASGESCSLPSSSLLSFEFSPNND